MASNDIEMLKKKWTEEQTSQRRSLILQEPSWLTARLDSGQLLIGGLDISFSKVNKDQAVATLAVLDMQSMKLVYEISELITLTVPYIPTFLAYREVEPFTHLYECASRQYANCKPHLLMVDGNGTLHPRGFGCACLLGLQLHCPTIGVAKNLLETGMDRGDQAQTHISDKRRENRRQLTQRGDRLPIYNSDGEVCGVAMLNTINSSNPIYVSPGHLMSLETACDIILRVSKFRTPEPTRLADQISREKIRKSDEKQVRQMCSRSTPVIDKGSDD